MKTYERTKHPALFRETYWGSFGVDQNADDITPEIITNRDAMAERFKIVDRARATTVWELIEALYSHYGISNADHAEGYRLKGGGILLLVSPYDVTEPLPGFSEIPPVYSVNARSFVRVFASTMAARKYMYSLKSGCRERAA